MFKKKKSLFYRALVAYSICALNRLDSANFSVDSHLPSGPSSFNDVIKSVNAIFPGEGHYNTIFVRVPLEINSSIPVIRNSLSLNHLNGSKVVFHQPLKSSSDLIKDGYGELVFNQGLECSKLSIKQGSVTINHPLLKNSRIELESELRLKNASMIDQSLLHVQNGLVILEQGGDFKAPITFQDQMTVIFPKEEISFKSIKGKGLIIKDGEGQLRINSALDLTGTLYARDGNVSIESPLFLRESSFVLNKTALINDPQYLDNAHFKISEGAHLVFKQEGTTSATYDVDTLLTVDARQGSLCLSSFDGKGQIIKKGQGELKLLKHTSSSIGFLVKEGSLNLKNGSYKGSILVDGGCLNIDSSKKYQNYALSLGVANLNVLRGEVYFSSPISLIESQARFKLNDHELGFLEGFRGEGTVYFEGPGKIDLFQKEPLKSTLSFSNLSLKTPYFVSHCIYQLNDVYVSSKNPLLIENDTILEVTSGLNVIDTASYPLLIKGPLKGKGQLALKSSGESLISSGEPFHGSLIHNEGELTLQRDVDTVIIEKNALLSGSFETKDLTVEGTLKAHISPDEQGEIIKAGRASILGDVIINPRASEYLEKDYLIVDSSEVIYNQGELKAPAQFKGELIISEKGLSYRLNEFISIAKIVKDNTEKKEDLSSTHHSKDLIDREQKLTGSTTDLNSSVDAKTQAGTATTLIITKQDPSITGSISQKDEKAQLVSASTLTTQDQSIIGSSTLVFKENDERPINGSLAIISSSQDLTDKQKNDTKLKGIDADNIIVAQNFDDHIAPFGSDIDFVISELIKLKDNPKQFDLAFQGLQPAYYSALGLVQESNFILARASLTNRMQELLNFTCAKSYVAEKKSYLWVDPVGDFTQQDSKQHDMGYHAATVGAFAGFDGYLSERFRLGISGGYTNSRVHWMEDVGKGWINSAYLAGYFLYNPQYFYLNGSLCGGYSHYNVSRYIRINDLKRVAYHKNHGFGFEADLEIGYVSKTKIKIQPYLRQSYVGLYQQDFTEHGASSLNLTVDSKKFAMYRLEAGLFFDRCFDYTTWSFLPEINISGIYEQELKTGTFHASYENTDQSYDVQGMKPTRYLFAPGISLEALIKKYPLILGIRYHAEIGSGFYDQRIAGHLGYSF